MTDATSIAIIMGILVGTIAAVIIAYRWYTGTTLYTEKRKQH